MQTSVATKTQCVFEPRAIAYLRGQAGAGTINLPRQFHGIGALMAVDPTGATSITATLLPPVGPRSQGNPPRATLTGGTAGNDVLLIQC